MKTLFTKAIAFVLLAAMMLGTCGPVIVRAVETDTDATSETTGTEPEVQVEPGTASNSAPEGYVPENAYLEQENPVKTQSENGEPVKKVLLIEDVLPWDSYANQRVLGSITEYTKVTTKQFLDVDLSEYAVIVFANDQPFSTYENYEAFKQYMELFASIGGVIVFGACDAGWSNGQLIEALPGDVTKVNHYEHYNYVADKNHLVITGALTDGTVLTDDELSSSYCSHVSFNEDSLPAGTNVILRESSTNRPTLIEYPLGKGRVIASGLTWEHNYDHNGETIYGVHVGDFADIALEDLYSYAIRVSSIDVDELYLLDEWILKQNAHSVIVADGSTGIGALDPIPGASVDIDGEAFTTDEKGAVYYYDYDVKTVTVRAEGYRDRKIFYALNEKTSRIFFLEKEKNDGLPYVVQATGSTGKKNEYPDLRDQALHFTQNKSTPLIVYMEGNWNGHGAGKFVIYQEASAGSPGKSITVDAGNYLNFAPGKTFDPKKQVKLKLVAADGTESEPINLNIIIDKEIKQNAAGGENALVEGVSKFDWIGNHPVKSDNEIFTKLLTADMSIVSDLIPLEISSERKDDGSITYKGVIGLVSGNKTKDILNSQTATEDDGIKVPVKDAWDEWKKQIKGYKDAGNPKAYIENLKKSYAGDWAKTSLQVAGEFDGSVAGYLEITIGMDGNVVNSEGGIIINFSGGVSIGQTFFAGPVPIYYEFKPKVEVEANLGIKFYAEEGWMFRPEFNGLELALPSITLEGGVGVRGVATVGLEGSGKMVFGFGGENTTSGTLKFGGAIHAKVIFVVDYKWSFWNTEIPLWPKNKAAAVALYEPGIQTNTEMTLASRDYLENASEWNGNQNISIQSVDPVSMYTLQYGVMPDAMPVIHEVGDKLVMLMLQDNISQNIGNHTQLVYSVYDNNYWSEPVPVYTSDTADFFFDSQVIDGKLYVAWQKSKAVMNTDDPETLLQDIAKHSEICVAVWDDTANSFVNQQYITSNSTADMMPALADDGKGVSIVWVNNSQNDLLGEDGTYTIYRAKITNGSVGKAQVMATTDDYVVELCAGEADSGVAVMYAAMAGDNTVTLYHIYNGNTAAVASNGAAAGLAFENGAFLWNENGSIYTYDPDVAARTALVKGDASASYQYVTNGTDSAIVWVESGDTTSIKAAMYENGTWCAPITLTEGIEETINFYDAILLEDGKFAMILNTAAYSEYGLDYTALKFAVIQPKYEVALQMASVSSPDWENGTQELNIYLENLGNTVISEVDVAVTAGYSDVLNDTIQVDLLPGEMKGFTLNLDVSSLSAGAGAEVTVYAEEDEDRSNNWKTVVLSQADVSLEYETYERGDELVFVFTIANTSSVPANVALSVLEDSLNGVELDVKNIGEITNENTVQYLYAMDKSKIDFDENGYKTYFFQLSTLEQDWNEADNYCFYTVSGIPNEETDPDGEIQEVEVINPVSVKIQEGDLTFTSTDAAPIALSVVITPTNSSFTDVEWTVENADIVHVTADGLVTPLRAGTTTITATVVDGVSDTITVTVGGRMGDVDCNGIVNTNDALLVLKYYTGAITAEDVLLQACDVDGNGTVNTNDALLILKYYTGAIGQFPAEA